MRTPEIYFDYLVPEYLIAGAAAVPVIRQTTSNPVRKIHKIISTLDDFKLNIEEIVFGQNFFDIKFDNSLNSDENLALTQKLILNYLKDNFFGYIKIVFIINNNGYFGFSIDAKLYFDENNNQHFTKTSILNHENYKFKVGNSTALYFRYNDWVFDNTHNYYSLKLAGYDSAFLYSSIIPNCFILLHDDIFYFLDRKKIFHSMEACMFESYVMTDIYSLCELKFTQDEIDLIKMLLY